MKHFLLIAAAIIGLSGVAWADALEEQAKHDPALAEAIANAKKSGHYSYGYQPSESDIEATRSQMGAKTEIQLRRMGMSPDVARKAVWASQNRPYSACAHYVAQLTADYENGLDRPDYDDKLVISIEHSGTCERKNLD